MRGISIMNALNKIERKQSIIKNKTVIKYFSSGTLIFISILISFCLILILFTSSLYLKTKNSGFYYSSLDSCNYNNNSFELTIYLTNDDSSGHFFYISTYVDNLTYNSSFPSGNLVDYREIFLFSQESKFIKYSLHLLNNSDNSDFNIIIKIFNGSSNIFLKTSSNSCKI